MSKPSRILMVADLAEWSHSSSDSFRTINQSDVNELGIVMYEAYKGTIDYDGETIEESQSEIAGTLQGKYGPIIQDACLVAEQDGKIVSAIIFNWFEKESMPLLTFTMTRSDYKGKGFAKKLIVAAVDRIKKAGYKSCCLVVTQGNEPAYSIYRSLGFIGRNL